MMIDTFETDRLFAKRLTAQDFEFLRLMHIEAVTMETLGGVRTEEETLENLQWNLKQWADFKVGLWLFFEKEANQFVGVAGLRHIDIEGVLEIDLAYVLLPMYWQQGYATEMAKACIKIGFQKLNFDTIIAGTRNTNLASQKVIEKLGFSFEKTIFKFGHDQVLYRLTRDEYYRIFHSA